MESVLIVSDDPPDAVGLLKMVWHPLDIEDDGRVKPTAFKPSDLSGKPDVFVSVDRDDIAQRATMDSVAEGQKTRAYRRQLETDGPDPEMETAKVTRLHCDAVRRAQVLDRLAFGVLPHPEDFNQAHCGIHNLLGPMNPKATKNRAAFLELTSRLAALSSQVMTFDEAYRT